MPTGQADGDDGRSVAVYCIDRIICIIVDYLSIRGKKRMDPKMGIVGRCVFRLCGCCVGVSVRVSSARVFDGW